MCSEHHLRYGAETILLKILSIEFAINEARSYATSISSLTPFNRNTTPALDGFSGRGTAPVTPVLGSEPSWTPLPFRRSWKSLVVELSRQVKHRRTAKLHYSSSACILSTRTAAAAVT